LVEAYTRAVKNRTLNIGGKKKYTCLQHNDKAYLDMKGQKQSG